MTPAAVLLSFARSGPTTTSAPAGRGPFKHGPSDLARYRRPELLRRRCWPNDSDARFSFASIRPKAVLRPAPVDVLRGTLVRRFPTVL